MYGGHAVCWHGHISASLHVRIGTVCCNVTGFATLEAQVFFRFAFLCHMTGFTALVANAGGVTSKLALGATTPAYLKCGEILLRNIVATDERVSQVESLFGETTALPLAGRATFSKTTTTLDTTLCTSWTELSNSGSEPSYALARCPVGGVKDDGVTGCFLESELLLIGDGVH